MSADHYNFHLIFKGLFRCVPNRTDKKLSVLLVDARSPRSSPTTGEPLRDHRAVIEFPLKAWRNRTSEPLRNLIEVNKRNKGKVGIFMLNRHDLLIGVSSGTLSPRLNFVDNGSSRDYRLLPQIEDIAPGAAQVADGALTRGENCIARVLDLDWGTVGSERPSTFDGEPLLWAYSPPREREVIRSLIEIETESLEKKRLRKDLANGREVNLDVRVTAQVPKGVSVILDPRPFPNNGAVDPPAFLLRPPKGVKDLEVWIKNRELDVILTESDQEGSEDGCQGDLVDFDFELQYVLSENPQEKRIPYRSDTLDGPVTAGGCACGGCSGGGGG